MERKRIAGGMGGRCAHLAMMPRPLGTSPRYLEVHPSQGLGPQLHVSCLPDKAVSHASCFLKGVDCPISI